MANAVGMIEVFGLTAAFVAADAGCKAANVTIKNIANIKAATAIGLFKSFCNIADIIITAIGNAKNINSIFIFYLHICIFVYNMWYLIFL